MDGISEMIDSVREISASSLGSIAATSMERNQNRTPSKRKKQKEQTQEDGAMEGKESGNTGITDSGNLTEENSQAGDSTANEQEKENTDAAEEQKAEVHGDSMTETGTEGETVTETPAEEKTLTETPAEEETLTEAPTEEETVTETPTEEETAAETSAEEETETPTVSASVETITVGPTGAGQQNPSGEGGNWGTVLLVVIAIVAVGAALAAFLLRKKQKSGSSTYSETAVMNAKTAVHQEPNSLSISCGMAQTIGKREQQQDSLYCSNWKDPQTLRSRGLLAAVADGIGGLKDGNLASQGAMQAMRAAFQEDSVNNPPPDRLLAYAAAAQKSVLKLNETSSCGATLVTVLITGKSMHFLSIGDSRIYLYRAGALLQLNREHILQRQNAEKEQLYGRGEQLTKKRAGALTSYLGKENLTQIDRSLQPMTLLPGDRIALMSDGVFNIISEQELIAHLRKSPEMAAKEIIQSVDAHDHPAQDNASVVVIGVE